MMWWASAVTAEAYRAAQSPPRVGAMRRACAGKQVAFSRFPAASTSSFLEDVGDQLLIGTVRAA
jgi:hypothetical protein